MSQKVEVSGEISTGYGFLLFLLVAVITAWSAAISSRLYDLNTTLQEIRDTMAVQGANK